MDAREERTEITMMQFNHHVEESNESCTAGAVFSQDRQHRYLLWRKWEDLIPPEDREAVAFVGINPSTAGANEDDATIRRVTRFAKGFGYSRFYMLNLCSFISTKQSGLKENFAVSDENKAYLREFTGERVQLTVCAWGGGVRRFQRFIIDNAWRCIQRPTYCLGTTGAGHPRHPLYLPSDTELEPFNRLPEW